MKFGFKKKAAVLVSQSKKDEWEKGEKTVVGYYNLGGRF